MKKLYGPDIRQDAGLTKTIKKVTRTQAKLLKQRAPELERVVQEFRGTFDKVYADTASIVEEFLAKCLIHLPLLST
jgi:phosphatidylethanolamine N-methyltransferase